MSVVSGQWLIEKLESDFWFCPECDDCSVMNMKLTNDLAKKDDCKHLFAAKVLERMTKAETLDLSEQDQVFVVQKKPKPLFIQRKRGVIRKEQLQGLG